MFNSFSLVENGCMLIEGKKRRVNVATWLLCWGGYLCAPFTITDTIHCIIIPIKFKYGSVSLWLRWSHICRTATLCKSSTSAIWFPSRILLKHHHLFVMLFATSNACCTLMLRIEHGTNQHFPQCRPSKSRTWESLSYCNVKSYNNKWWVEKK